MAEIVVIGGRDWTVEFDIDRLKESEAVLNRPIVATIRDDRGWRGFTLAEIENLLWVQARHQTKRLTRDKFIALMHADLREKKTSILAWQLVLLKAFNASELAYHADTVTDEQDAAEEAAAETPARPRLVVAQEQAPAHAGTSETQAG